jgi:hypothetical protein
MDQSKETPKKSKAKKTPSKTPSSPKKSSKSVKTHGRASLQNRTDKALGDKPLIPEEFQTLFINLAEQMVLLESDVANIHKTQTDSVQYLIDVNAYTEKTDQYSKDTQKVIQSLSEEIASQKKALKKLTSQFDVLLKITKINLSIIKNLAWHSQHKK